MKWKKKKETHLNIAHRCEANYYYSVSVHITTPVNNEPVGK